MRFTPPRQFRCFPYRFFFKLQKCYYQTLLGTHLLHRPGKKFMGFPRSLPRLMALVPRLIHQVVQMSVCLFLPYFAQKILAGPDGYPR